MAVETKITTPKQVSELRKSIGQSVKKIANSAQEFVSIPKSGIFVEITTKEFDIPNVGKKKSIGLLTQDGKFIAENSIFASSVTDELVEIKGGDNKGKFMLRQERVSPELYDLGDSQDKRLVALIGQSFETENFPGFQLKEGSYTPKKMFVSSKNEQNKQKLLDLREPKTYKRFIL